MVGWGLEALFTAPLTQVAAMEQCASVEREVDRVLQRFLTYGQRCEQSLEELLHHVGQLRAELAGTGGWPRTEAQGCLMTEFWKDGG